jgi:hypothetical protein
MNSLRKFGDVIAGIFQRDERAAIRELDGLLEAAGPAGISHRRAAMVASSTGACGSVRTWPPLQRGPERQAISLSQRLGNRIFGQCAPPPYQPATHEVERPLLMLNRQWLG